MKAKEDSCTGCLIRGLVVALAAIIFVFVNREGKKSGDDQKQQPARNLTEELSRKNPAALQDGIAVMLLIDASGSMNERVRDTDGTNRPKIEIAKRAANQVLKDLAEFSSKNPGKKIEVGISHFSDQPGTLVTLAEVDVTSAGRKIEGLEAEGGTAIGEALVHAKKELNSSSLHKRYVIVLSDGENTDGINPVQVLQVYKTLPQEEPPGVYFVAFDIQASRFEKLKNEGAVVLEATNAEHLQQTLDYVLYQKILVEEPL